MNNKIALVFDFDDTLAKDSTTGFLKNLGVDTENFWKKEVPKLLDDGWDPIPAYLYKMIEFSNKGCPITRDKLRKWGKQITFFKGVTHLFPTLRKHIQNKKDVELEFYIISSGIGEILRSTKISKHFTEIWASDFAYDKEGNIIFPKRVVSFTDKTRYLFHISKGLIGPEYNNKPFEVNKKVGPDDHRIPFRHIIFVGDGYTDIPCFSLVTRNDGISIAVYDKDNSSKWNTAWDFVEENRVKNLVPADYSKGSALVNSLIMAIDSNIKKMELSEKVYQR